MAASTMLGNPAAEMMLNNWPTDRRKHSLVRRCLKDAVDKFFTTYFDYANGEREVIAWCDFGLDDEELIIGQEPAYQYEHLNLVVLRRRKELSYRQQGVAWGAWGSDIASNIRLYKDYRYASKFTKFVDRWHPLIFGDDHASN